jgi:hypothetical protein
MSNSQNKGSIELFFGIHDFRIKDKTRLWMFHRPQSEGYRQKLTRAKHSMSMRPTEGHLIGADVPEHKGRCSSSSYAHTH